METGSIELLQSAAAMWPADERFRLEPLNVAADPRFTDDAVAVLLLWKGQEIEPYSATIMNGLIVHSMRLGYNELASEQFRRLVTLAPKAQITKALLSQERVP